MKCLCVISVAVVLAACAPAETGGARAVAGPDGTQWHRMSVERLPDLQAPRGSHRTLVFGDEIVVLGGHTDGFKPLETAEYYADGAWHTVSMMYPHENGFAAPLPDGTVLLGGGSAEAFGIGQSWGAEIYDPGAHSFTAVGIMSRTRAMSSALTRPDGSVVIVGNWYADDGFETWSPEAGFQPGGSLSPGWAEPYVFPASREDIIVFGPWDTRGGNPAGRVDHLGREVEQNTLLADCSLNANYYIFPEEMQIADYSYLVLVRLSDDEPAILKVASGEFSFLEMDAPLPARGLDGHRIDWMCLQVDRPARLIWMQGFDSELGHIHFARIDYDATFDGGKASATYYYAEAPGGFPGKCARLLPGGSLVLAGGTGWEKGTFPILVDNFKAYASVYLFHTEEPHKAGFPWWILLVSALRAGVLVWLGSRRRPASAGDLPEVPEEVAEESRLPRSFMEQMSALIEEKELFRRKNLRITDVASELATNKTYVSVLVNNLSGESFTSMIARYRVEYAQKLLREHPDMLLDDVADQSGFSSYTTFFRNFKSITGMTPQEWKASSRS